MGNWEKLFFDGSNITVHVLDGEQNLIDDEYVPPEVIQRLHASSLPAAPGTTGLDGVTERIAGCTLCSLHKTRTRTVPGQGNATPEIIFIGERKFYRRVSADSK